MRLAFAFGTVKLLFVRSFPLVATVVRLPNPLCGGDEEDRTPDPLRARQVLSQLSYTPML